jgi:hypothetical protein
MKTNELTGAALDWAVTHANYEINGAHIWNTENCNYSTDWALAGPIIEREGFAISRVAQDEWSVSLIYEDKEYGLMYTNQHGTTPLIAAMRCYVASKLGDEVELPEDLTNE